MVFNLQYDMVQSLIDKFNETIELLIKDFKEFNFDEKALGFLATRTRNFITFCDLTVNNIIFSVLGRTDNYSFDDEISKCKEVIRDIFDNMNHSLDHILEHDHEEEAHVHDHSHEHHIHIDVDDVQDDINSLLSNLESLKALFDKVSSIVISSVKFQLGELDDSEFNEEYLKFKKFINEFKL